MNAFSTCCQLGRSFRTVVSSAQHLAGWSACVRPLKCALRNLVLHNGFQDVLMMCSGADWLLMDLQAPHTATNLCPLPESPWGQGALVLQGCKGTILLLSSSSMHMAGLASRCMALPSLEGSTWAQLCVQQAFMSSPCGSFLRDLGGVCGAHPSPLPVKLNRRGVFPSHV